MAAPRKLSGTEAVDDYMKKLQHPQKAEIEAVRAIILKADRRVAERVKWNAPSFYYRDDIAAFNPRAKRFVQLVFVFHRGKMIDDRFDLLEGDYKDRRLARFINMNDVRAKENSLQSVVRRWIELTDAEF